MSSQTGKKFYLDVKSLQTMQEIFKKLRFKETPTVVNAPSSLTDAFVRMKVNTTLVKGSNTGTLVFVNNETEYTEFLKKQLKLIEPDSVLWFAYPKGTSKIKTDINRDSIRETGEKYGITTVTAVSIDETWSALRFRPIDKVGT